MRPEDRDSDGPREPADRPWVSRPASGSAEGTEESEGPQPAPDFGGRGAPPPPSRPARGTASVPQSMRAPSGEAPPAGGSPYDQPQAGGRPYDQPQAGGRPYDQPQAGG